MAEQKDKKTKHLRSARQWLTRAEESFDKDREVRGELDLFLAQAELQHAQEGNHDRGWMRKYSAISHGLAVIAAVMLAGAAYGMYNQLHEPVATVPPAAVTSTPIVLSPAAVDEKNAAPLQPTISPAPAVSRQVEEPVTTQQQPLRRRIEEKHEDQVTIPMSEQRLPVSAEEMKSLIRAAGKSLRGK